jgi:ABC-2 type transport system permease protein
MKSWETFRFAAAHAARRPSTWLYFAVLLAVTLQLTMEAYTGKARAEGFFFNAPFVIAEVTLVGSLMALVAIAALAGDAGARDAQTRMDPLVYTAPVSKAQYLGGRFLAALFVAALLLAALPAALLVAARLPGPEPELIGPFRGDAYVAAYLVLALPNAFIATALLFAAAALTRRAAASYVAAVLLFFSSVLNWLLVAGKLGKWEAAKLMDPLGLTPFAELARSWTPLEKNTRLVLLEGSLLANRLLWIGVALAVLALTHLRFRFAHHAAGGAGRRRARSLASDAPDGAMIARRAAGRVPRVERAFGAAARVRQLMAVAGESFRVIVAGWGGAALAALTVILVMTGRVMLEHLGVPLVPTTGHVTSYIGDTGEIIWAILPLLVVYYAGELVWRERDARLGEIADAAPAPEWVFFAGKLLGLSLVLVAVQALVMAASMLVQARAGYFDFEPGLYARILFGIQLADHFLFALLAVVVHVVVNQKYVGHLVMLLACAFILFAPSLGVEHNLLVYRADPGWTYSDMRGFGPFLGPWLAFKLYWGAWALALAVAARLLWVRGTERGARARLELARRRFTRPAAGAAALAVGLVLALGGFVFYNTNVLNDYRTLADEVERSAEYERRYGRFEGAPQPRVTAAALRVEIHPSRRTVEIRGSYRLVNDGAEAIDTVHLAPEWGVETGEVSFDRPARRVVEDAELGHRIYVLATPLAPGDSLRLAFSVRHAPRGFRNGRADASVAANGTYFRSHRLPAVGYQPDRELSGAGERRAHGLPPRPAVRPLDDARARWELAGAGAARIALDVVVGTDEEETAVAPGALRRTWSEGGRRYFHYVTDAPIRSDFALFSARYAVREARWSGGPGDGDDVTIQVFHHPGHPWNVERMIRSVRASLDYHARRFGPYPYRQLRLVEHPGAGAGLHAYPVNVSYDEGFALFHPEEDPRGIDFPFAVVSHEVAHQWWGNQVSPAYVEGGPLLTESLAWYSALGVVEEAYGRAHLERLLAMMREAYLAPRARAALPLLRATDRFHAWRKGPFAMYALREYVGADRVDAALRRLLRSHGAAAPPLPTSLDLYRELRAATPDSLHPLLHDLFAANTYWELSAEAAAAEPAGGGRWRVTLDVRARKVVADTAGIETEVAMDDLVEIGVFAAGEDGRPGAPLYRRMHRVRSGPQRITIMVAGEPARAGIDPRPLLIDDEPGDNVVEVARAGADGG